MESLLYSVIKYRMSMDENLMRQMKYLYRIFVVDGMR